MVGIQGSARLLSWTGERAGLRGIQFGTSYSARYHVPEDTRVKLFGLIPSKEPFAFL